MKDKNILLANFLGWEKQTFYLNLKTGNLVKKENDDCEIEPTIQYIRNNKPVVTLKFDTDWNWLMQVVDKIEKVHNRTVQIERGVCYIHNGGIHHGRSTKIQTKIEAVYNTCVEFVEWWNKEEYQKAVMNSIDLE